MQLFLPYIEYRNRAQLSGKNPISNPISRCDSWEIKDERRKNPGTGHNNNADNEIQTTRITDAPLAWKAD